jgi:pilus assembly protein CpaB
LPSGTIISADSFRFQPWPQELVESAYFLKDKVDAQSLVGTVVRFPITAGQPLTQGALVHPEDRGFLAAALGAGMRAVTVKVSQEEGVAGFVFPGDRVDVILSQQLSIEEGSSYPDDKLFTAETIVNNVRVLATDQRTSSENAEGKSEVVTFGSVTLEATPEIAEKIAVAQSMGRISLSLRPLAESAGELDAAIASGEVNVPPGAGSASERAMMAAAAARPSANRSTATTGGDVSRFWVPVNGRVNPSRRLTPQATVTQTDGTVVTVPRGPVVRISRGDKVTEITVGGK